MTAPPISDALASIIESGQLKKAAGSPQLNPKPQLVAPPEVKTTVVTVSESGAEIPAAPDVQELIDRLMKSSIKTGEGRMLWLAAIAAAGAVIFGIKEKDTTSIIAGLSIIGMASAKHSHDRNNLKIETTSVITKLIERLF